MPLLTTRVSGLLLPLALVGGSGSADSPLRTGRISIERLVGSRVMEELMELAMMGAPTPAPALAPGNNNENENETEVESPQEAFVRQQRAKNWFSAENALRVYSLVCGLAGGA